MHYLAARLSTWHTTATSRLEEAMSNDRGDGPTDNGLLIAGGVTAGLLVVGAVAAAVDGYVGKIK